MRVTGLLVAATAIAAAGLGCTRDPATECVDLAPGDLVVTEFRGEQDPEDSLGIWVELYNASGDEIDLAGIKVRFRKKDGSDEVPILVRRSISVAPGAYAVLGLVPDTGERPSYIDYGFSDDFDRTYLPAAAVDVEMCGERIDRAVYDVLPKTGTYSFGGSPPDATNNDIPAMWCTNASSAGTPKMANPPCP